MADGAKPRPDAGLSASGAPTCTQPTDATIAHGSGSDDRGGQSDRCNAGENHAKKRESNAHRKRAVSGGAAWKLSAEAVTGDTALSTSSVAAQVTARLGSKEHLADSSNGCCAAKHQQLWSQGALGVVGSRPVQSPESPAFFPTPTTSRPPSAACKQLLQQPTEAAATQRSQHPAQPQKARPRWIALVNTTTTARQTVTRVKTTACDRMLGLSRCRESGPSHQLIASIKLAASVEVGELPLRGDKQQPSP